MSTVLLSEIITSKEARELRQAVKVRKTITAHSAVMEWARSKKGMIERWQGLGLVPDYAGYLLEYHLQLS